MYYQQNIDYLYSYLSECKQYDKQQKIRFVFFKRIAFFIEDSILRYTFKVQTQYNSYVSYKRNKRVVAIGFAEVPGGKKRVRKPFVNLQGLG